MDSPVRPQLMLDQLGIVRTVDVTELLVTLGAVMLKRPCAWLAVVVGSASIALSGCSTGGGSPKSFTSTTPGDTAPTSLAADVARTFGTPTGTERSAIGANQGPTGTTAGIVRGRSNGTSWDAASYCVGSGTLAFAVYREPSPATIASASHESPSAALFDAPSSLLGEEDAFRCPGGEGLTSTGWRGALVVIVWTTGQVRWSVQVSQSR